MMNALNTGFPPSTPDPVSRAAAASMVASVGSIRRRVFDHILQWGPLAEWEIERDLGLAGNTARPRVWELHRAGLIKRLDKLGQTPSGRACYWYIVTILGRSVV